MDQGCERVMEETASGEPSVKETEFTIRSVPLVPTVPSATAVPPDVKSLNHAAVPAAATVVEVTALNVAVPLDDAPAAVAFRVFDESIVWVVIAVSGPAGWTPS